MNLALSVDAVVSLCETLIQLDDPERALMVLDNLPAKYRENPPEILKQLKSDILSSLITAHGYMSAGLDASVVPANARHFLENTLRGRLLLEEMKQHDFPYLIDIGPGEYPVPIGLLDLGYRFGYRDIGMDKYTREIAFPLFAKVHAFSAAKHHVKIAILWEIIEHIANPIELAQEAYRYCGGPPDVVHLSTPYLTYDENPKDWRKPNGLPHRRTYTPKEFVAEACRIFTGYEWQFYPGQPMSLRGLRSDNLSLSHERLPVS